MAGRVPDAADGYAEVFVTLFSNATARHAYENFQQRDPLAGAVTRDRTTIVWRAWRTARRELAQENPLAAWRALQASTSRAPLADEPSALADIERHALASQCLAEGHQVLPALEATAVARAALRRFQGRLASDRDGCARELRRMLSALAGLGFDEQPGDDGIVAGWAATRGVELLVQLAQRAAELAQRTGADADATAIALELESDAAQLQVAGGVGFDPAIDSAVRFALGDMLTEREPLRAFAHFDQVANALGLEDSRGLQAATNAAHCLLRAGRFQEAESRLGSLESLYEYRGDMRGAARVWLAECLANWKRLQDPAVRRPLVGAIVMYEDELRHSGDPRTRYVQKRFIEPGYLLLLAVVARSTDRSDEAADLLLSALWALASRDALADLEMPEPQEPWKALLERQQRPLMATRSMLAPFPGLAVVHLHSATDLMVWLVYGFDLDGRFRLACHAAEPGHADRLVAFIQAMHDQLEADRVGDALATAALEATLETLGREIADELPADMRALIAGMTRLVYMPDAFGNVDEFPLAGLRLGDAWLGARVPIVRSPSINHLREMLAPNRIGFRPDGRAVVVTGSPDASGEMLLGLHAEAGRASHILQVLGFEAHVNASAGPADMRRWLDGGAGAMHYLGHGIANRVMEGLPLADGEQFGPLDVDQLDGMRVPFVFLCACMAARVRAGSGGYQTGVASKLIERGGPAVVAFTMPVIETRAYALAESFYRAADRLAFGAAVQAVAQHAPSAVPAYARLAFTAYGDPAFSLTAMTGLGSAPVPGLPREAVRWHSQLRNHCVLRSETSAAQLRDAIEQVPAPLRDTVAEWLAGAFKAPSTLPEGRLAAFEGTALAAADCDDVERLSVRAAVLAERLHASGIEDIPLAIATDPASIRSLLDASHFLALLGGALFDMHLNALGNSLMARVITVDQNDARRGAMFFRQARQQLRACEDQSPFVATLRADDLRLLQHFGIDE